jgi:multiple sugar transport system permease protein
MNTAVKENSVKTFFLKLKKLWQNFTTKVSEWMDKGNRTTVIFLLPYVSMFCIFIVLPVLVAIFLSFTYFNGVSEIQFTSFNNYIFIFTQDQYFMRTILPNTILFAIIVGPGGYVLSFLLAWVLSQLPKLPRTIMTLIVYSPSMTSGIAMTVLWKIIFSGDEQGYLNSILLRLDMISEPIQWLQSGDYLMPVMIIVTLWGSMGVGFLAMLSGILSINRELYEAAYLDGISNRFQEIVYITVPAMKNQMLFGAVMAIVGAFSAGAIGVQLTGSNPTPNYAGQLIVNHIDDYGILRRELGMSAALSVILLIIVYLFSWIFRRLFSDND